MAWCLLEHWYNLSDIEKMKEVCILLLVMITFILINFWIEQIKRNYMNRVLKSENKILKFIFNRIL